jgi:hypothetical protein
MFSTIWPGFFGLGPRYRRAGRLLVASWIEAALTAIVVELPGAADADGVAASAPVPIAAAASAASANILSLFIVSLLFTRASV